jgi:hypothetical protein
MMAGAVLIWKMELMLSKYTSSLTARSLIITIANERKEQDHIKIARQRDWVIDVCREWLEENGAETRPGKARLQSDAS